MYRRSTTLMLMLAAILFSGILCEAGAPPVPFMTVDEFTELHPGQRKLMDDFNAIVNKRGVRTAKNPIRPVKIAFIYPGKQISDYWRRSITSFKRRMDEIGLDYEIHEYFSHPGVEQNLQEAQIREALRGNPDYLVFTLDVFKHKSLVEEILSRPKPKLILQNITTPLREWEGKQPFMYVGFDHGIGSRILADYYISKTDGFGTYGLLYFTRGYVSTMRGDSFLSYVGDASKLKMVDSAFTDGKAELAFDETNRMLSEHDLKFLYACSTDIAMGAIRALKGNEKLGKVMINGWGGGSSELEAILAGDMDVTVMRMNDDNGVAMAEGIRLDMGGHGDRVPTIYSGEMVLVEKGISKKELNKLIKRAFRYSGK